MIQWEIDENISYKVIDIDTIFIETFINMINSIIHGCLSKLTAIIYNMELTHLGSEGSTLFLWNLVNCRIILVLHIKMSTSCKSTLTEILHKLELTYLIFIFYRILKTNVINVFIFPRRITVI